MEWWVTSPVSPELSRVAKHEKPDVAGKNLVAVAYKPPGLLVQSLQKDHNIGQLAF